MIGAETNDKGDNMNNAKVIFAALVMLVLTNSLSWAQEVRYGSIDGTVTDLSGKAVQEAKVIFQNIETKVETAYKTNSRGNYIALDLLPGSYDISVEKENYKKTIYNNFRVLGGRYKNDIKLEPGKITDVIVIDIKPENIKLHNF
jgi:hypothetical protein